MINSLILLKIIKGGKGSGNFGHKGRKGVRGGSSSYSGGKPSLSDFINTYKMEKASPNISKPILNSIDDLKPPKSDHTRILHGTALSNLTSIDKNGVLTGAKVGKKEKLNEVLGYSEDEYKKQGNNVFGEVTIVADVPSNVVHKPNSGWLSVNRSIRPNEIKGYLVGKISVSPDELAPIISEYNKRYS